VPSTKSLSSPTRNCESLRTSVCDGSPITLLDTGALLNECYLRLLKVGELNTGDKAHFLGYAGRVMRSIVVDFARERLALRRGGDVLHVEAGTDIPDPAAAAEEEVVRVDEALQQLARLDARLVQVVELKYFGGLKSEEIAAALGICGAQRAQGLAEGPRAAARGTQALTLTPHGALRAANSDGRFA
jgi:RNA polymerase sigma factor (TIGR02999 family)